MLAQTIYNAKYVLEVAYVRQFPHLKEDILAVGLLAREEAKDRYTGPFAANQTTLYVRGQILNFLGKEQINAPKAIEERNSQWESMRPTKFADLDISMKLDLYHKIKELAPDLVHIVAARIHGLTYTEIGEKLSIPRSTVCFKMNEIRKELKWNM